MVSFAYRLQLRTVADICQSFVLDNGAFTTWKGGHATIQPNITPGSTSGMDIRVSIGL